MAEKGRLARNGFELKMGLVQKNFSWEGGKMVLARKVDFVSVKIERGSGVLSEKSQFPKGN